MTLWQPKALITKQPSPLERKWHPFAISLSLSPKAAVWGGLRCLCRPGSCSIPLVHEDMCQWFHYCWVSNSKFTFFFCYCAWNQLSLTERFDIIVTISCYIGWYAIFLWLFFIYEQSKKFWIQEFRIRPNWISEVGWSRGMKENISSYGNLSPSFCLLVLKESFFVLNCDMLVWVEYLLNS